MSRKYQNLLSPIQIGNTVFKNRLIASPSAPLFAQGSEDYPTEATITHYANKAKNGVALVVLSHIGTPIVPEGEDEEDASSGGVISGFDVESDNGLNYLSHLSEAVHFYGAKISMQIGGWVPAKYDVSTGIPAEDVFGFGPPLLREQIPVDLLDEVADTFVRQAVLLKQAGFDSIYLHMAYRLTLLGRFLSPMTNKRGDQCGGSLENQARFPLMVADRIKKACGNDFFIFASISGTEPPGGRTLEETIELTGILAGHIDLLQIRGPDVDLNHPTGFISERTPYLHMAEAIKKSDPGIAIVAVSGFQDPALCDDVIASGKADFISMARCLISNPDYGRLVNEGRGEDVVPCIRCNICLISSFSAPRNSVCSVNPVWGLEHKIDRMIKPPTDKKRIAIVGGGPAGMKGALIAFDRGHSVTLYEKSDALGGLLNTTESVSFKWPLKNFKDYLVRQTEKASISVLLNTEATPEMLKKEKFDAILVAVGAEPIVPPIPGVDGENVVFAQNVYGNEDALAEKVVIIGGGEVGVETGMHLAEMGREIVLLEVLDRLASHAPPLHFYNMFRDAWEKLPNFKYHLNAHCTDIKMGKVTFRKGDTEHTVEAGSVVIAVGMKVRNELVMSFYGAGDRFFMIGDCSVVGNVQKAIRSAFGTASML
jgi:2,4-dienoyl-CoA reductase-like NADH-dependent reductase (Old Yellow Enzyme family)/NADPH-dependent 2,4-dienoyl-CoA reductase/sulfur reductase-like enzyme